MLKQFIPFTEIDQYDEVLVVDSYHPRGFALSHWRGAMPLNELSDDTSVGIVLNAIKNDIPQLTFRNVTNNHFDIDGFIGVWTLFYPEMALRYEAVLKEMALIGDFRELNLEREGAELALKLVCWINTEEKAKFYAPFGYEELVGREADLCVAKYHYFLENFDAVLQNPEIYKLQWKEEYERVLEDYELVKGACCQVGQLPGIRLHKVEAPRPLHYYALYSGSEHSDVVLSVYPDNRYELEYKYHSWVDTAGRLMFPRVDLRPLAEKLNQLEESGHKWYVEKITDTAPMLRLDNHKLSKMQRYDDPYKREILSSSIPADILEQEIKAFLQKAYAYTERRRRWSWQEMREVNKKIAEVLV